MVYAAVGAVPFRDGRIPPETLERARRTLGVVQVLPLGGLEGLAPGVAVIARGRFLARQVLGSLTAEWSLACFGKAASVLGAGAQPAGETCTAQLIDGRLRVWAPTRDLASLRERVARLACLEGSSVEVCATGEGEADDALLAPVIALARLLHPAPVQLLTTLAAAAVASPVAEPVAAA